MVFTHLWPKRLLTLLNPEWTVEDWSITQVHIVPLCLSHDLQIGRGHFHVNVIFHTKNVKSTYKRSDLSGQCSIPVYVPWSSYEYFYSPCIRLQNSHIFCKHEWHSQYSNKRFGASVETARDAANIPRKVCIRLLCFTRKDLAYGASCLPNREEKQLFCSLPLDGMLVHHRVIPSIQFSSTHLYTQVNRGTVRVKYLAQESTWAFCLRMREMNGIFWVRRHC